MITILGGDFPADFTKIQIILSFAISALATVALYVFRSIGLVVMAKRAKLNHVFLACLPILWVITVCQLIGKKTKFFGKPFVKWTWLFCLAIGLNVLVTFVMEVLVYFPLVGNFFMGREIAINLILTEEQISADYPMLTEYWGMLGIYHGTDFVNPYGEGIYFVKSLITVLNALSGILSLASIFATITLYVNLFRKYWPQHHVLATIFSALGVFGPFVFAVRNKEPMEYIDYLRSHYQAYGPYGNPYGGQGGYYGNPYAQQRPKQPEHPFKEYAERGEVDPGDPFDEFNTDKKDE